MGWWGDLAHFIRNKLPGHRQPSLMDNGGFRLVPDPEPEFTNEDRFGEVAESPTISPENMRRFGMPSSDDDEQIPATRSGYPPSGYPPPPMESAPNPFAGYAGRQAGSREALDDSSSVSDGMELQDIPHHTLGNMPMTMPLRNSGNFAREVSVNQPIPSSPNRAERARFQSGLNRAYTTDYPPDGADVPAPTVAGARRAGAAEFWTDENERAMSNEIIDDTGFRDHGIVPSAANLQHTPLRATYPNLPEGFNEYLAGNNYYYTPGTRGAGLPPGYEERGVPRASNDTYYPVNGHPGMSEEEYQERFGGYGNTDLHGNRTDIGAAAPNIPEGLRGYGYVPNEARSPRAGLLDRMRDDDSRNPAVSQSQGPQEVEIAPGSRDDPAHYLSMVPEHGTPPRPGWMQTLNNWRNSASEWWNQRRQQAPPVEAEAAEAAQAVGPTNAESAEAYWPMLMMMSQQQKSQQPGGGPIPSRTPSTYDNMQQQAQPSVQQPISSSANVQMPNMQPPEFQSGISQLGDVSGQQPIESLPDINAFSYNRKQNKGMFG